MTCFSAAGFVQFPPSDAPHGGSQRDDREQPGQQCGGGGGAASPLRHPPLPRPARHPHGAGDLQEEEGLGGDTRWQQQVGRRAETSGAQVRSTESVIWISRY